uniref:Spectrin repeat containing, nuclear envelope 2b n=1 Tax=Oncorhynchus tshawytscha TaxID=74940 RepID=A0AAZ3SBV4_ONCTS
MEGVHPAATLAPGVFPAPALTGACPTLEVLYAYSEQATQLEVWLERAQHTLGVLERAATASMQDSVEQQLLTCQEMFLEIEQKVASLSVLEQQEGSAGSHQEAELLSSKLELLKTSLVTFQLLLQERQSHEQMHTSTHTEEQVPSPSPSSPRKLPLEGRLQRSGSVQEILSSSKSKLFRQTSFQQQKELEQELSEQRGLTKAIAQQGSRGRLHSQAQKDQPEPSTREVLQGCVWF